MATSNFSMNFGRILFLCADPERVRAQLAGRALDRAGLAYEPGLICDGEFDFDSGVRGGNYLLGRASYGSFNTTDLQAAAGIEKDGLAQNYAVALQRSDGYRDHSEAQGGAFSGKLSFTPQGGSGDRWRAASACRSPIWLTNLSIRMRMRPPRSPEASPRTTGSTPCGSSSK